MVGSALLRQLALDLPYHKLVLLTRHPERTKPEHATAVFADIAVPSLGLNATTERLLQARAELFFHCAADTRFNLPLDLARRVNTHGTQQVLDLARACRNLRHFAHISTLYVAGRREGVVPEQPLRHRAGYVNSYEASKHEAEALVLSESAAMPVGIYRLSSVIDLFAERRPLSAGNPVRRLVEAFPVLPRRSERAGGSHRFGMGGSRGLNTCGATRREWLHTARMRWRKEGPFRWDTFRQGTRGLQLAGERSWLRSDSRVSCRV